MNTMSLIAITTATKKFTASDNPVIDVAPPQSREEYMKMIEQVEFQKRANIQMNEIVNRFIAYKREELKLEDYETEEIEKMIENILRNEHDEYYDYSSDEDDDSVYSDEDSFWIKLNSTNYYNPFK